METSYITTGEPNEHVVPRGINYFLLLVGHGMLYGMFGFLGSLLLGGFDEQKVPRWASFLAFLGLALLLGRALPIARWWKGKGARCILIYSDSPIWKSYIENRWLPAAGDQLELINISQHHHWKPSLAGLLLEAHLAARKRPSLPAALILSERPILLDFHGSFLDHEAGDDEQLKKGEQRLTRALGISLA